MSYQLSEVKPFYLRRIMLDLPPSSFFVYRHDNNMALRREPSPVFAATRADEELASSDVIVVGNEAAKRYILAGAVTAYRSLTHFLLVREAGLMRYIEVRQKDIAEGETPEEVVVLEGDDWRELLCQYADICAERAKIPAIDSSKNLTGYCTWYYYYANVTEKDFLENFQALKEKQDSCYKARVAQIDDGYQTFQGDWNDQDPAWPTPLPEIGKRIVDSGMTAGIWLMPFQASTASRIFREHPDWFVQDENGEPIVSRGWSPPPDDMWACLDTTIPAVQEHLVKIFRTFYSWGFRYFKMDGLSFGLMPGRRSDPNATPVSAFRLGLQTIRNAVPDCHLLGCCPPYMACLGLVDSVRISDDTHASWGAIRNVFYCVLSRFWMFDRMFRCDPDVVIARQDRGTHTLGESRISALGAIMTGISLTSDNLSVIDPDRLELLGRAANIRMRDMKPFNWNLSRPWPDVFTGTVDGRRAVAIANDSDQWKEYRFDEISLDPEQDAEEILQPAGKRKYTVAVAPHDAVLLVQ